jgi:acyl-CoA reductase-like NAD-dependent aldehyde dehydrogenase
MSAAAEPLLIAGQWQPARERLGVFRAREPATGDEIGPSFPVCGAADVEAALSAAVAVADALAAAAPERIAAFLDRYADAIDADADQLVALAHAETALPAPTRLRGNELPRTSGQLRQAANDRSGAGLSLQSEQSDRDVHTRLDAEAFVADVLRKSPASTVVVDEASFEYVDHPGYGLSSRWRSPTRGWWC